MILMGIARSRLADCWPDAIVAFFADLSRLQTRHRGDIDLAARYKCDTVVAKLSATKRLTSVGLQFARSLATKLKIIGAIKAPT
jgi:hypothetical protein